MKNVIFKGLRRGIKKYLSGSILRVKQLKSTNIYLNCIISSLNKVVYFYSALLVHFTLTLDEWYKIDKDFLGERSISSTTRNFIIPIQELELLTEVWKLIYLTFLLIKTTSIYPFLIQQMHLKVVFCLIWKIWLVYTEDWVKVWSWI